MLAHRSLGESMTDDAAQPAEKPSLNLESIANLAKALAWPAVALVAIFLFLPPISEVVTTIAKRAGDIGTVKLGNFELVIHKPSLPVPDKQTASILQKLSSDQVERVIQLDNPMRTCSPREIDPADYYWSRWQQLISFELVEISVITGDENSMRCAASEPVTRQLELTDAGHATRDFLIRLLASQIGISQGEGDVEDAAAATTEN